MIRTLATPSNPAPKGTTPPPPPQNGGLDEGTLEKVLDSNTVANVINGMKSGETVTISSGGTAVIEIKRQDPSRLEALRKFGSMAVHAAADTAATLLSADKSFAFRQTAWWLKQPLMNGVPDAVKGAVETGYLPALRVMTVLLDGKRAWDTFHDPNSKGIGRVVDAGHIATDAAGLAGAVMMAVPGMGPLGTVLSVVGILGDFGAYGYHLTEFFSAHPEQWPPPDPNPNPNPNPGPTQDPNQPTPNPTPGPAPQPQPQPTPPPQRVR